MRNFSLVIMSIMRSQVWKLLVCLVSTQLKLNQSVRDNNNDNCLHKKNVYNGSTRGE